MRASREDHAAQVVAYLTGATDTLPVGTEPRPVCPACHRRMGGGHTHGARHAERLADLRTDPRGQLAADTLTAAMVRERIRADAARDARDTLRRLIERG